MKASKAKKIAMGAVKGLVGGGGAGGLVGLGFSRVAIFAAAAIPGIGAPAAVGLAVVCGAAGAIGGAIAAATDD